MATILQNLQCGTCGVEHAIPKVMYDACREEGGFWHCPNGHSRGWKVGLQTAQKEQDAIRLERDRLKQQLAQRDDAIAAAEKLASVRKGQVTKLRKRAAGGVCACCNRTVSQMAKHMASKHPTFRAEEVA